MPPTDYITIALCVAFFASAWGIVKWRKWAHTCAFGILLLEVAAFCVSVVAVGWGTLSQRLVPESILSATACVWLALPAVRMALIQRQQIA